MPKKYEKRYEKTAKKKRKKYEKNANTQNKQKKYDLNLYNFFIYFKITKKMRNQYYIFSYF